MRIIYAGTPEFAVPALEALVNSGHQVVAVYTQPDRPAGRGRKIQFSAVKTCALQYDLDVIQPQSFKQPEDVQQLQDLNADLMVVAAYGILLPESILQTPRLGCVNIHGSILPRWRGAAPIQRCILADDRQTGITLMQMDKGLDTGAMLAKSYIDIGEQDSAADLHDRLKKMGAQLLIESLPAIQNQSIASEKQDDNLACYASKLSKQEALIDWNKSAQELHREVRAFNPWPVSFTSLNGQNIKVWSAGFFSDEDSGESGRVKKHSAEGIDVYCGQGLLRIKTLQFAGKKQTSAQQLIHSRDLTGEILGG